MHYLITTVGPLSQDYLTHALLTYMNYPSYIPNAQHAAGNASLRPSLLPGSRPMGAGAGPGKPVFGPQKPVFSSMGAGRWPGSPSPGSSPARPRSMGTPMQAFTGNGVSIAPGIELRQMGNAGRTYQDLFFWQQQAGGRTHLLSVVSRGAFHHWQQLPHGWDNAHLATIQPVSLGSFQPGQPPVKSVRQLTSAEKLAHAIYLAKDYVGEEAKALIDELTSPSAVASLIAFEAIYTISLFFGVGEVVTGLVVIAGVIFVGEVVLDIIGSLVKFVKLATGATDEAGLRAAAKELAHALTLGAAIVTAIVLHKAVTKFKPGNVPENVVRNGGGGKKKPVVVLAEEAAVEKGIPVEKSSGAHPDIPDGWTSKQSKKGGGTIHQDPANPHNSIRIMPGNPNSPNPSQQGPYVIYKKNGVAYDANGKPLPNADHPDAHIPLSNYDPKRMPKF